MKREDLPPEVQEAIERIMKTHGATEFRMAPRYVVWIHTLHMIWGRAVHHIGIHTRFPSTTYDANTGMTQYTGLRCIFCGSSNG